MYECMYVVLKKHIRVTNVCMYVVCVCVCVRDRNRGEIAVCLLYVFTVVCMYVCMHVCMYACIYACIHLCMNVVFGTCWRGNLHI